MLKDFTQSGRSLKGNNYTGYDDFNNSSEEGLYVWLKFNNQEFEVNCYITDNHVLDSIVLINEEAKEKGDIFGEHLYELREDIEPNLNYRDLIKDIIIALRKEEYIPETIEENYGITFKEAKEMPIYNFSLTNDNNSIAELIGSVLLKDFKDDKTVIAILKFGYIDIELNVYCYDDVFELEYYICKRNACVGWNSYSESNTKVVLEDNIEETMFNELIRFAKEHKLYWSIFND